MICLTHYMNLTHYMIVMTNGDLSKLEYLGTGVKPTFEVLGLIPSE